MWTQFFDLSSGGGGKEPYDVIMIEAEECEAKVIFYNRFGHNPERVSCTCCGQDYSIDECKTLNDAYHYQDSKNKSLVIRASDIKDSERVGDVPEQGYVWR